MIAGVYSGKEQAYVFLYSPHPDVMLALPPANRAGAVQVAQASYMTNAARGISVYKIPKSEVDKLTQLIIDFRRFPTTRLSQTEREALSRKYSIKAMLCSPDCDERELILELLAKDVNNFAEGITPTLFTGTTIESVNELKPVTTPKYCGEARINDSGKQDYVPSCLIDLNIDFFRGSCITQLTPDGYYSPFSRCDYCYASGTQQDIPTKRLLTVDRSDLVEQIKMMEAKRRTQGKLTRHLRFGKVSEAGSKLTRKQLLTTLEACVETGLASIFPTKFLEYDLHVAELLKRTDGALLYSIGADGLEQGAVEAGCNNQFRMEQALRYHAAGVKCALYLLIEASNSSHSPFAKNLELATQLHHAQRIPLQLLPLRPVGRKQLALITGKSDYDLLREGQRILSLTVNNDGAANSSETEPQFTPGGYFMGSNNQCVPCRIDPGFLRLLSNPLVSMCHHTPETTWCGGCLHREPQTTETVKVQVERFRRRKKKRPALGQIILF